MTKKLPEAPAVYSPERFQAILRLIEQIDSDNFKKGQDVRFQRHERLILSATDGSLHRVTVSPAGVLGTATA